MKTQFITILSLAGVALFAAETPVLFSEQFEGNMKFFKNSACLSMDGGGKFEFVDGGISGKCLKITTNAKQTLMLNTSKDIPVNPGDKIKVTMMVKGKGKISTNPMGVANKKTYYLGSHTEKVSADQWEKLIFIITMKEPKGAPLSILKLRLNFHPNSNLLLDDLRMEKMNK